MTGHRGCGVCRQYIAWMRWARSEPSALRAFLSEQWHVHRASTAAATASDLDVERLAEAIFRVAIGRRVGMVALPWALENQQSFAQWCSQPSIAAEYSRLGANKIS